MTDEQKKAVEQINSSSVLVFFDGLGASLALIKEAVDRIEKSIQYVGKFWKQTDTE